MTQINQEEIRQYLDWASEKMINVQSVFQVKKLTDILSNNGYTKSTAYDLQWQSLHMAAAAACRAVSPSGE